MGDERRTDTGRKKIRDEGPDDTGDRPSACGREERKTQGLQPDLRVSDRRVQCTNEPKYQLGRKERR